MKNNKFIIIVPVYNSEKYIQKCLESILTQNYDNYELVVIDDCSIDKTTEILKNLNKNYKFNLIINEERIGSPLSNFIKGIDYLLKDKEDILITVDGDDWLSYDGVLSYLNDIYQDNNIWMTYGQYQPISGRYNNYCKFISNTRTYRRSGRWLTSHLRTVKVKLFDKIDKNDLKDENGEYYKMAGDLAYMFPIVEMAGNKHIKFITKTLYIYNDLNPYNEMKINQNKQLKIDNDIRLKNIYDELNEI